MVNVIELDDDELAALLSELQGATVTYGAPLGRALARLEAHSPQARPAPLGVTLTAVRQAYDELGTHDGNPMSSAPSNARGVLLAALVEAGVMPADDPTDEDRDRPQPHDDLSRPARPA